jgi:thiosulfate/3-mercaptopyruvate sulfurtransferase
MRFLVLLVFIAAALPSQASIQTLTSSSSSTLDKIKLLDARTIEQCLDSSVSGALCLPAGTFYSKEYGLASFHHINWVLGTMGLSENDHLLVFADNTVDRDAVAGLLFLAGQRKVSRWDGEMMQLQNLLGAGSGQARGATRTHIYAGATRDKFITLAREIPTLQQAGWTISSAQLSSEAVPANTIVSADSPMIAVAIFATLLANGHQTLKVVIDKLAPGNSSNNKIYVWLILMLIFAAMLLTFILWKRSESINRH